MKVFLTFFFMAFIACLFVACSREDELTLAEINEISSAGKNGILAKTASKPWHGESYVPGKTGGIWYASMTSDPKSFNMLVAERDGETTGIVEQLCDSLVDYDYNTHEFKPNCAAFEIKVDSKNDKLTVVYTLRDDLFWTWYKSDKKIKVTSDDVVFWYNEIEGDTAFHSSAYNGQFVTMKDGSQAHIDIEKIDDRRFAFHFPRIDANPILSTNRSFGPRFAYEKAKKEGGIQGVLSLFSVAVDPVTIPSMGMWYLAEYTPGQRLVFKRNPNYWKKDSMGVSIPYIDEKIVQLVPDQNTQLLLFKEGKQDSYGLRPEDLDELANKKNPEYTVFSSEGSLGASFWCFNQNPKNAATPQYGWFTKKEFRQAMSCLLNRDRIIAQTYRGLAEPKKTFFPEPNPYYNPSITLKYLYDTDKAKALLLSIGMKRGSDGVMRDNSGHTVEFDMTVPADNSTSNDIASIIVDECSKLGIKVKTRSLDFQKVVEQLSSTFDWQSVIIGLGSNYWPTQGSNVWPSNGNLHLWYPLQEKPATDWEARIDYLYNEGSYAIDHDKAMKIWNEYQETILEQCPIIYLVRPLSFVAVRNRWDFSNLYFDNVGGLRSDYVWLTK